MSDALNRFWTWANQPVSLGSKKSKEPAVLENSVGAHAPEPAPEPAPLAPTLLDEVEPESGPQAVPESSDPNEYLGFSVDEVVDGVERYLESYAVSDGSEISWVHLLNEIKVIQLKRMKLTDLENECMRVKSDLINCKKNLALHVKRATAEGSLSISMHEKRLELARAVNQRIDSL